MISLCKAMGGSWYPYKETAVSTYRNCGIHTWTLSFPALETAVSRLGIEFPTAANPTFACLDESKSYSHLTIILTLIPVTPMNKGFSND